MRSAWMVVTLLAIAGCRQLPQDADWASWFAAQSVPQLPPRKGDAPQPVQSYDEVLVRARQAESTRDYDGAIEHYRALTAQFPDKAEPLHRLAVLHDEYGDPDKSTAYYQAALRLAPTDTSLLTDYGYSRYLRGNLDLAERLFRQALETDSGFARAHNNMALVFVRRGQDDQALEAFQRGGLTRQQSIENLQQAKRAAELSVANVARTK